MQKLSRSYDKKIKETLDFMQQFLYDRQSESLSTSFHFAVLNSFICCIPCVNSLCHHSFIRHCCIHFVWCVFGVEITFALAFVDMTF